MKLANCSTDSRYTDHKCWRQLPNVAFAVLRGSVGEHFDCAIAEEGALEKGRVLEGEFKDVSKRKNRT
jgi:hypothetical protein